MAEKSLPKVEEFLSDPKYAEQKGFLKGLILGIAKEAQEEEKKNKPKKKENGGVNIFDALFGGADETEE